MPAISIPSLNNCTKGISDICKGIIIEPTTKRNRTFFPRNSMKAKAYAAKAAIVIGIIVEGIVTAREL